MKKTIGCILCVLGVSLGVWVGVGWAFIGGIVDIVSACKAVELSGVALGFGILKVICSGFIGWGICALSLFIGLEVYQS